MSTTPASSLDELMSQRRAKRDALRAKGINPYPTRFEASHAAEAARAAAQQAGPDAAPVSVAGRLMTRRDMGKAAFAHLQDRTGRIQIYLKKDELGEAFSVFQDQADLGDVLGVTGRPFVTRTGEPSLHVTGWTLLAKALRPPPEKFHGMTDVEDRYRRREVDLFSNEEARRVFLARRRIVSALRAALDGAGFAEVETPLMQPLPGGAAARPFITRHNTLEMDLYLRVAPELYLKRLLVGGLERVYEIGRAFRNEGIDTRHNPEFTILEAYQAYTNYEGMMDLAEGLFRAAARAVRGNDDLNFTYRGASFSLAEPFARLSLVDLFPKHAGLDYRECLKSGDWRGAARRAGLRVDDDLPGHKCFDAILDEKILPHVPPVAFVFGYPSVFSPLAKANVQIPEMAERFELFVGGEEVANAYSEQNDPDVQRAHFERQAQNRRAGDEEAMPSDEAFLEALEQGMPPAGGLGIGVDRLTMILAGVESIREVIFFPLLKPRE